MVSTLAWWRVLAHRLLAERRSVRRRRYAVDEYQTRHLIQRTLADQAALRRRAPSSAAAAMRYEALLRLELAALEELERSLSAGMAGPGTEDVLAEARAELEQLRTEVGWCGVLLRGRGQPADLRSN